MSVLTEYPTHLAETVVPIPSYVDQAALNERGLMVVQGLTPGLAVQLASRSEEADVALNCPGDAATRFPTLDATQTWQEKGRLAVPLVSYVGKLQETTNAAWLAQDRWALERLSEEDLILRGFGWMGPGTPNTEAGEPDIPGAGTTLAIRLYTDATGQGNATPYLKAILGTHGAQYGNMDVWLAAWGDNLPALKPYKNAGFTQVGETMALRDGKPTRRVFQTLGRLAAA